MARRSNVAAFRKGLGASGLRRGPECRFRVPLVGWPFRALAGVAGRRDPAPRGGDRHARQQPHPRSPPRPPPQRSRSCSAWVKTRWPWASLQASRTPAATRRGSIVSLEVNAKRLGLDAWSCWPKATRFGMLVNPGNATSAEAAAKALTASRSRSRAEEYFSKPASRRARCGLRRSSARTRGCPFLSRTTASSTTAASQIATLAVRDRIATGVPNREMVEAGALMSYGTSIIDAFRQVGAYVSTILKGSKPADLPVLQASKFEFVINLQTARVRSASTFPRCCSRAPTR